MNVTSEKSDFVSEQVFGHENVRKVLTCVLVGSAIGSCGNWKQTIFSNFRGKLYFVSTMLRVLHTLFYVFRDKLAFKRITNVHFFSFLAGVSLAVDTPQHAKSYRGTTLSHAARTHVFKKLRAPSRCRECESYVYFQGAECQQVRAWFLVIHAAKIETFRSPVKNL